MTILEMLVRVFRDSPEPVVPDITAPPGDQSSMADFVRLLEEDEPADDAS
jgi:hypothetical protein